MIQARCRMMRTGLVLGALFIALGAYVAQVAQLARAADAAVVEARLLEDMKFLTSKECEGRGIQTKGINLAADFVARGFQKAGLKPAGADGGYFQPFDVSGGARLNSEGNLLVLRGPQGQRIELAALPAQAAPARRQTGGAGGAGGQAQQPDAQAGKHFSIVALGAKGKVSAPVVFVGYGISAGEPKYDEYAGLDVAGKVVIVLRKTPQSDSSAGAFSGGRADQHAPLIRKLSNAEVHKAAAVILVNDRTLTESGTDRLMPFEELSRSRDHVGIPAVHLRRHYANHLVRTAFGTDLTDIEKDIDRDLKPRSRTLDGWTCEMETNVERQVTQVKNVIGVLEGSGPKANETVILGAHYDHLGYGGMGSLAGVNNAIHFGADDNASGTTAVIELARRFGAMKERKGRRLVFMTFTAEESGLLGSAHYCQKPIFPLESTVAMVNMDMVGRLRDDKITIGGTGTAKNFAELIDELNVKHKFNIAKDKTGFGPSDHQSFYARKVPVFFFFTNLHEQYHRPTDTWDTINIPGIRRVVDMVEELTINLATADARPEYVQVTGSFNPGRISIGTPGGPRGPRLGVMPNYVDEKEGMLLDGVTETGVAKKAGLLAGDRILQIGDKPVKNVQGFMSIMGGLKVGDKVEVTIERKGKQMKVPITLE